MKNSGIELAKNGTGREEDDFIIKVLPPRIDRKSDEMGV